MKLMQTIITTIPKRNLFIKKIYTLAPNGGITQI